VRQCTCVTGEEWLRRTFDPALRMCRPPHEELRAELQALSETGLLSGDQASRASARLDEDDRERWMIVRGRTERALAESRGDAVRQDRLEGILTPERSLGVINEVTVVLMRVELWTLRLILRLEARQSGLTHELDLSFDTEWKAWERRWVEHRAAAEAEDLQPPEQPSVARLGGLPLSVVDDLGTRYHGIGTATGGSDHPWRSEWRIEPAVPASATVLKIALEDGASASQSLELALPSRRDCPDPLGQSD
jgi:hypothetical protein